MSQSATWLFADGQNNISYVMEVLQSWGYDETWYRLSKAEMRRGED